MEDLYLKNSSPKHETSSSFIIEKKGCTDWYSPFLSQEFVKNMTFHKFIVSLYLIMCSNWFKYFMMVILLVFYINRGLFVAMPGLEMSCAHSTASNEINSLLEIIINWTGGQNRLDEDGDSPESYNIAKTIQPLIDQNQMYICLTCPYTPVYKIFYIVDEAMSSLYIYGTIDHPPELLIVNC